MADFERSRNIIIFPIKDNLISSLNNFSIYSFCNLEEMMQRLNRTIFLLKRTPNPYNFYEQYKYKYANVYLLIHYELVNNSYYFGGIYSYFSLEITIEILDELLRLLKDCPSQLSFFSPD